MADLRAAARAWRRHGWWAACQVTLEALVNRLVFFERLHIIELQRGAGAVDPSGPALSAASPTFSTRVADEAALEALRQQGGWGVDSTKFALLRSGDTCLLSLVDGRPAGYTWVHTQGRPEILPGLRLQLPKGVLYNFAGFTHPDFRGAGLQARRHEAVLAQRCWADYSSLMGYVKATNFSSRKGQARSGYRQIGLVLLVGARGRLLAWRSPALRKRGVQLAGAGGLQPLARLKAMAQRTWVALVSHTAGPWLHRRGLGRARRSDHHTYTCFHRAPMQLAALGGPVLAHLGLQQAQLPNAGLQQAQPPNTGLQQAQVPSTGLPQAQVPRPVERRGRRLRVLLYACSNGAEAYTLSAWLAMERPDLEVIIEASDLHPDMVERARAGRYTWDEVTQHHEVPERFIAQTFDRDGEFFVVNERTRSRVRFSCADIVHDDLRTRFGEADIVLAQNVLFHLPPPMARRAFANVVATLAPGGALFVEGMDLDLRVALTSANDLRPLGWRTREIYEESRRHIPARWWRVYYGAEPWLALRREPQRRYGSVFLKEPGRARSVPQALAA